ncbi:MAG TPA: tetratricopeptide repeat protein [Burkholderiales bacterium]|nr:tetratricopeptide repeat protein [Burkholderiales bacterium]
MKRLVSSVALLLIASGCAGPPARSSAAARHEAAIEANRRGEAYVRRGELENAARSYREALRLSQSLEDPDGIAANAVNLSIVRQRQGRFAEARSSLDAVLEQPQLRFAPSRLAEASLRHALVDLDEGRFGPAGTWLARSSEYCAGRCALSAAIHNTGAQLALKAGRADEAAAAARAAHDAARAAGDRSELANALRLLGISSLHRGDAAAARTHLEQALALDRELGAPRKIALDLLALGRAAALAGEPGAARAYYARALAVSEAARDGTGAAEARAMLDAAAGK